MDRRIFLGSAVASAVGATLTACGGGGSDPGLDPAASMERSRTTTTTVVNPPTTVQVTRHRDWRRHGRRHRGQVPAPVG